MELGLPEHHHEMNSKAVRAFEDSDSYHVLRPGYSVPATQRLLRHTGILDENNKVASSKEIVILELGCGTGLLTKTVLEVLSGCENVKVISTDPLESMGRTFRENFSSYMDKEGHYPKLEFKACVAENLPLENGSVNVVVAGASYHWFATQEAYHEIARVLAPNGMIGYITKLPDEKNGPDWVKELWKLLWCAYELSKVNTEHDYRWKQELDKSGYFTDVQDDFNEHFFQECGAGTCVRSFSSWNMVSAGTAENRRKFEEDLRNVLQRHFTDKGIEFKGIPYLVDIHYCQKK